MREKQKESERVTVREGWRESERSREGETEAGSCRMDGADVWLE